MSMEAQKVSGQPIASSPNGKAIAKIMRSLPNVPNFRDRKKGVTSYQSHVKSDPWILILFALCFVVPTLAGALYYGLIASDRYVTEVKFAIRPSIGTADKAAPDAVGTNAGVVNSTVAQDTLITQEYVLSRPMLEAIEAQLPIREWFGRDSVDFASRLDPEKPIEKALRYWKRRVSIDVESASGIMGLTVEAFDPDESLAIAQAILNDAEQMLGNLSMPARQDALVESTRELKIAQDRVAKLEIAQTDLRNREGLLDAEKSNEANLKLVSELRGARINLAVQLSIGQRDLGPESRRIIDIKQQIKDLDDNIARIERQATGQDPNQKRQLASALTRFEALEHERKGAIKYAEEVRKAYDRARILVARQPQFFNMITAPVKANSATEPRRALMISLVTAGSAVLFAAAVFARKTIMS
ncbi:capsule biosynthesis protein [Methylobacterium pseudosasicola]|uniref:Capsular polysaccharide transport system permease protein n=1 Tax=Methylobacterium pseudosasicola TaxID=582667 RepID=A0A1I4RK53_9HYPH|nr:capsule biosynthesis protein [Methylobacterium pseudosasicola]SFM52617.1 capsular polysaccharide transport system permease protein [Methylobacterium pseudosasicola]